MRLSNREAIRELTKAEQTLNFDGLTFKGYNIYPFFRSHLHTTLTQGSTKLKTNLRLDWKWVFYLLACTLLGVLQSFRLLGRNIIVLTSEERFKGSPLQERVAGILPELLPKTTAFLVNPDLRRPNLFPYGTSQSVYLLPFLALGFFLTKIPFLNRRWNHFSPEFNNVLTSHCNTLGLNSNFHKFKNKFVSQYVAGQVLFYFLPIHKVFVVNSPSFSGFICAAKDSNLEVIELQHGVINDCHPSYHYERKLGKSSFPDTFLFWGGYFQNRLAKSRAFSDEDCRSLVAGYYSMDKLRRQQAKQTSERPCVLFTGQEGEFEEKMLAFLHAVAKDSRRNCVDLIYLPRMYKNRVADSIRAIGVHCDQNENFYSLLLKATHHISIFSTTIYESLGVGIPTACLQVGSKNTLDYFGDLVEQKEIAHIDTVDSFFEWIEKCRSVESDQQNHFFADCLETIIQSVVSPALP